MSVVSSREEILSTIKRALSNGAGTAPGLVDPPILDMDKARPPGADLVRHFESELTGVGGRFYRAANAESVCAYILQVAAEREAKAIVAWEAPLMDEIGLKGSLTRNGISFGTDTGDGEIVASAAASDIGVTGVDYALAETGSLVLLARKGQSRSVSLLPPVHIALIKPGQVLSGFDDLFAILHHSLESAETALSSAITFITGPSRTADIELTLVVGVHGPQELHVVLLEG